MQAQMDLAIRGGLLVDGSGGAPVEADVGIAGDRIAAVGAVPGRARREIDARGKVVMPGFVDIHTHYDGQVTWESRVVLSSSHGVTTVVMGNCGVGFAPCRPDQHDLLIRLMEGVEDIAAPRAGRWPAVDLGDRRGRHSHQRRIYQSGEAAMMVEKRGRKTGTVLAALPPPRLAGPADAEVTLVGWGSTWGVIRDAAEALAAEGISTNHLHLKWLVPFHAEEVSRLLGNSRRVIIVENNYSGQLARYLRSETGFAAHGHIRKYDGEPFMPHHIVHAVKDQLSGKTTVSVPAHEISV